MIYHNWWCLMQCRTACSTRSVQNNSRTQDVTYSLIQPSLTQNWEALPSLPILLLSTNALDSEMYAAGVHSSLTWYIYFLYFRPTESCCFALTTPPSLFNATKPLLCQLCNKPFPLWHCTPPSWHVDAIWQLPSPLHRQCVWNPMGCFPWFSIVQLI